MQTAATQRRSQRSALRAHFDTLLLSSYGLKWNTAADLPPGEVYSRMFGAYKQHLEQLAQLPHGPMQQAAALVKNVLDTTDDHVVTNVRREQFMTA